MFCASTLILSSRDWIFQVLHGAMIFISGAKGLDAKIRKLNLIVPLPVAPWQIANPSFFAISTESSRSAGRTDAVPREILVLVGSVCFTCANDVLVTWNSCDNMLDI